MGSVIYVVRPSGESIARSLCLKEGDGMVLFLNDAPFPGRAKSSGGKSGFHQETQLSYDQVLALLVEAEKVITL